MVSLTTGDTRLIIKTAEEYGLLRNQLAYVLATAYHETGSSMKPIKETVMPSHKDKNPSDATVISRLNNAFAKGQLKWVKTPYWRDGWFGRGYVQLTHKANYESATKEIGIDLVSNPSRAMEPEIAAKVLILGSKQGWFTGKKLSDYITLQKSDFKNARRIINGTDKADLIAGYAREYDKLLKQSGYGVDQVVKAPVAEVLPEPETEKPISKSSRFWTWLGTGGGTAALPFVDWRVQLAIAVAVIAIALYAIFTMPQAKAKLQKIIDGI